MWITDYGTLNINNYMLMVAVFLDIEEAFETIGYLSLLYEL
jgi:hypothetical protein